MPATAAASTSGSAADDPYAHVPDIVSGVAPSVVTVFTDAAQGSGVIFDASGLIVTNNHVVASGANPEVSLSGGQRVPAQVLGADPRVDLAVIKIDKQGLPAATFATGEPRLGSLAIAIGDPLGFENSVTVGVVSGLHRSIPGSAQQSAALVDLLQTDAAISPGNSGGALVSGDGSIIGINVAYIPPSATAVSIGFAIPAGTVADALPYLQKGEAVPLAYMGIYPVTLTAQLAQRFALSATSGALVADVGKGGPADAAGIRSGDVITALAGQPIASAEDLLAGLRQHKPDETVDVALDRSGNQKTVQVKLGSPPAVPAPTP